METPHIDTWIKSIEAKKQKGFCSKLEQKRLIEIKELKKALSLSDVVKCACCNNLATHLRCQKCHDDEVFGLVT